VAGESGKSALASALPWLALGGLVLLLIVAIRKGLGPGGLSAWFRDLLGLNPPDKEQSNTGTQQDSAGQDHESSGVGSAAVTGHFSIHSGDALQLETNLGNVSMSAIIPFDLVNSSPTRQQVLVQVHVYEDYLFKDEQQTWEELVTVDGLSGRHVEANVVLPGIYVPLTRPQLFLDLTVAGVHQDRVEHVETH
jgi:hypothetical protein